MKEEDFAKIDNDVEELTLTVLAETGASAYLDVTLTKEQLDDCRDENGKLVKELIEEVAQDEAFSNEGFPDICAHCSGWGQRGRGIDLGEWESVDDEDAVRLKS
jgi:hypothetical protein